MTVSIIHSGRLPLSRNASTTLRRLTIFLRLASLVAARISLRSVSRERVDVDLLEHLEDRLAAHAGRELVVAVLLEELHVALFGEQLGLRAAPVSFGSMTMYASQ